MHAQGPEGEREHRADRLAPEPLTPGAGRDPVVQDRGGVRGVDGKPDEPQDFARPGLLHQKGETFARPGAPPQPTDVRPGTGWSERAGHERPPGDPRVVARPREPLDVGRSGRAQDQTRRSKRKRQAREPTSELGHVPPTNVQEDERKDRGDRGRVPEGPFTSPPYRAGDRYAVRPGTTSGPTSARRLPSDSAWARRARSGAGERSSVSAGTRRRTAAWMASVPAPPRAGRRCSRA